MKVLVLSDHEEKQLYDYFDADRWVGVIDFIISCGDLRHDYLSYLVTVLRVPLLYVAGNHDYRYRTQPPEGCDDINGKVVRIASLRVGGLAGSPVYNAGADQFQYTPWEMRRKVGKLSRGVRHSHGVDIVVSHAAPHRCPFAPSPCSTPAGLGRPCIRPDIPMHPEPCPEASDPCHRAVPAYDRAIARWKPRWWLHGHNHIEYGRVPRVWWVGTTQVVNADGHVVLDTEKAIDPEHGSIMTGL